MAERHHRMEPNAEQRTLAKTVVGLYVALIQEGMTADEALTFLARWASSMGTGEDEEGGT